MTARQPGILDTLGRLIPGYRGYADRDDRRTADKRLRDHVAGQLDACKRHLDEVVSLRSQAADLTGLDAVDSLKRLLGTCADTLRNASYGESGLMDDVQIKAEDLDSVQQYDLGLHHQAEDVAAAVKELTEANFAASLPPLRDRVQDLLAAIKHRDDLLRQVFD